MTKKSYKVEENVGGGEGGTTNVGVIMRGGDGGKGLAKRGREE